MVTDPGIQPKYSYTTSYVFNWFPKPWRNPVFEALKCIKMTFNLNNLRSVHLKNVLFDFNSGPFIMK